MSEVENKIKIGITHGDVNGVGYEVILKAFGDKTMLDLCTPVVYGSKKYSEEYKKLLKLEAFQFNYIDVATEARKNKVNLVNCCKSDAPLAIGEATEASGKAAFQSLNAAVNDLLEGKIDAIVTAPINKKNIQSESFEFPGHTEFLGEKDNGNKALMFMVSEKLKVGVVTGHIPLNDVSSAISEDQITAKLKVMNKSLKEDFSFGKPKIAVLGLNPHAGDNGLLGSEEQTTIIGAIKSAKDDGILAHGPFAADGFFGSSQYLNYDAVLAMYHDQGLIPFKALSFGEGVNYTAGLSFVRTSPDHGTGYDIAGKNVADCSSLRQAIYTAIEIVKNRSQNKNLAKNALKSQDLKAFEQKQRRPNTRPQQARKPATPKPETNESE